MQFYGKKIFLKENNDFEKRIIIRFIQVFSAFFMLNQMI
jgi:hypothetical protein